MEKRQPSAAHFFTSKIKTQQSAIITRSFTARTETERLVTMRLVSLG